MAALGVSRARVAHLRMEDALSIPARFSSHSDAVKAGWFSRRHETSEPHRANPRRDRQSHKITEGAARNEAWRSLTTQEKLASLATRRGNSTRQVERLTRAS